MLRDSPSPAALNIPVTQKCVLFIRLKGKSFKIEIEMGMKENDMTMQRKPFDKLTQKQHCHYNGHVPEYLRSSSSWLHSKDFYGGFEVLRNNRKENKKKTSHELTTLWSLWRSMSRANLKFSNGK